MKRIEVTLSDSDYENLIALLERDRDDRMKRFEKLGVDPLAIKWSYTCRTEMINAIKHHTETYRVLRGEGMNIILEYLRWRIEFCEQSFERVGKISRLSKREKRTERENLCARISECREILNAVEGMVGNLCKDCVLQWDSSPELDPDAHSCREYADADGYCQVCGAVVHGSPADYEIHGYDPPGTC